MFHMRYNIFKSPKHKLLFKIISKAVCSVQVHVRDKTQVWCEFKKRDDRARGEAHKDNSASITTSTSANNTMCHVFPSTCNFTCRTGFFWINEWMSEWSIYMLQSLWVVAGYSFHILMINVFLRLHFPHNFGHSGFSRIKKMALRNSPSWRETADSNRDWKKLSKNKAKPFLLPLIAHCSTGDSILID